MISLNKFMTEVKNKLKRLEEKHNIKESISLTGISTCSSGSSVAGDNSIMWSCPYSR